MRSSHLPAISLFLVSAAAGWALQNLRAHPAKPAGLPVQPAATSAATRKAAPLPRTPEDFLAWAKDHSAGMEREGYDFRPKLEGLEDWSIAELRAALEDGMRDPSSATYSGGTRVLVELLKEWTQRDPDAAWAWFENMPSESMRWLISSGITNGWPAERAEEGWQLVLDHPGYFENSHGYAYGVLLNRACESAAKRGPAAVAALMAGLRQHRLQTPFEGLKFPAGFDFIALAKSPEIFRAGDGPKSVPSFVVDAWMRQSPDAAFDGLLALSRDGSVELAGSIAAGMRRINLLEPELMADRMNRIAAKTASLEPEERQRINESVVRALAQEEDQLKQFCRSYQDPEMLAEVALQAARPLLKRSSSEAFEFLELSPSLETRMASLEQLWPVEDRAQQMNCEINFKARLQQWGVSEEDSSKWIERVKASHP